MSTLPLAGDGPLKSYLISLAFEDMGMSDSTITPEERSLALRRLNVAMQEEPWSLMGYIQPDYGDGKGEEPSGIATADVHAVAMHLAMRLFASFEKEPSAAFRAAYTKASLGASARWAASSAITLYAPGTIRGAGARRTDYTGPYFPEAE
jgi:hypothetical protein